MSRLFSSVLPMILLDSAFATGGGGAVGYAAAPQSVQIPGNFSAALSGNSALLQKFLEVRDALSRGLPMPIDQERFTVKSHTWFHKVAIAAATAGTLRFFNATPSQFVTNWPGGGSGLPNDQAFWCTAVRADVELPSTTLSANEMIAINTLFNTGEINFQVGDRRYIDALRGLKRLPTGYGIDFEVSSTLGTTAVGTIAAGAPVAGNKYPFVPVPILPGKPIGLTYQLEAAIANLPTGWLTMSLEGILISPANS